MHTSNKARDHPSRMAGRIENTERRGDKEKGKTVDIGERAVMEREEWTCQGKRR